MGSSSKLRTDRLQPPVRRVLAVDAGSSRLRLALVKSSFGRVEILRQESFDLHEEGLVATEELKTHLQSIREECGHPPIALTLAQHLSISQTIDLPQAPEREIRKLIEDETVKLTGVSDSAIVHDFIGVDSPTPGRQQFWVTLCKEGDIEERIRQLGLDQDELCEVTTTASALAVAYQAAAPQVSQAILVHLGAQSTVVVVLSSAQAVFAASFPVGGDSFTRAIAKARRCSVEEAESIRRSTDLLGKETLPELAEFVDGWAAELKRQINECFTHRRDKAGFAAFALVANGTAFNQPGLLEYLNTRSGLALRPWPVGQGMPVQGFEIAYGAALQALGHATRSVSLLPAARRGAWRRRLTTLKLESASAALLVLCFLALVFGVWQKISILQRKEMLLAKAQAALDSLHSNQALTVELLAEYERLRPLLERQQNTADTLETLALLQQSRSNRSFWYVLMADQQSYFSVSTTNRSGRTNAPGATASRFPDESFFTLAPTNVSPAKPGLIAELCVPEDTEGARRVLSQIVNDLKERPIFNKVDLLSDDLRRNLADPKVILPERHFALSLNFAATEFHTPTSARRLRWSDPAGASGKSGRRPTDDNNAVP